ncbi:MAG TPA: response regulator [Spirochaetota bacterium]|nr:response regulator [Spirochaetota bacterium]
MPKTVLVIDDDEIIRLTTEEILHELGYHTLSADSGDSGLKLFIEKNKEIDLILLDLTMPGRSVVDIFADMLKTDPGARVLISSGNSYDPKVEKLRSLGAKDFLQKPYTITDMENKIKENSK